MRKRSKILLGSLIIILLLAVAGIYFINKFFSSFAPAEVVITDKYISSNREFINGVNIEKLQVDSIGRDNYPVKYTVTYVARCRIDHPKDKPPNPPNKIEFKKEGKYWWVSKKVNLPYNQNSMTRGSADSLQRAMLGMEGQKFMTCPIKFEMEQWYYFTLGDPKITGIFLFIDKYGEPRKYTIYSGVSPI